MTEPTDHLADGHRHTPEFTEKVRRNQQKLAAQRSKRCWKPSRGATDRIAKPTGPNAISHLSSPDCLPACADELRQADIGDIRTTDDGAAVIHVKGKGGKERSVPIEAELLAVIEAYLDSRTVRFPSAAKAGTAATDQVCRGGPPAPPCLSAATASASPVEPCNLESSEPSNVPALTHSLSLAPWCMDSATPTPPNSLAQTSASTR